MASSSKPFKWERHPRGSQKEFLNQEFPKYNVVELYHGVSLPCYHRDNTYKTHKLGEANKSKAKPQTNTLIDLNLSQCHNLQVIYDRQQVLGLEVQGLKQQLEALELRQEIQDLRKQIQKGFDKLAGQIASILEVTVSSVKSVADQVVKEAKKPKEEEAQTLRIAEDLEVRITEVKNLIQQVEGLIPS